MLIFWNRVACNLITVFLYSYMVLFEHACDFFSRFVGSRNCKIQIVARVGSKSAVVLPGTTEASYPHFFVGQGFESGRALLENVERGTFTLIRLRSPREWKNRTRLDEYYFFYYLIPPEDVTRKKNMQPCEQVVSVNRTLL